MDLSPQARETKAKINKWDLIKLKSFALQKKPSTKLTGSLLNGTWSKRNGLHGRDFLLTGACARKGSHHINFKVLIGASVEAFNQAYSFKQDHPPALRNQTGISAPLVPGES